MSDQKQQQVQGYKDIDPEAFQEGLESPNTLVIDVRTPAEFAEGHLPNAKLINIMEPNFQEQIMNLEKNRPYYLYCHSGVRSAHACAFMSSKGFKECYNLATGIIGWKGPIEK